MDPLDWVYLAEGGKHAVFAYKGRNGNRKPPLEGRVLRLEKSPSPNKGGGSSAHVVMRGILNPYLDATEVITVPGTFVSELKKQSLEEEKIPETRIKTWGDKSVVVDNVNRSVRAELLFNYRRTTNASQCLSIEIKPKAGYASFSPLVHPLRRAKFRYTRFQIMQQLQQCGLVKKGWSKSKLEQTSRYSPLSLFSGKQDQIRQAIDELFECPQNNLSVWFDDICLFGNASPKEPHPSKATIYKAAFDFFFGADNKNLPLSKSNKDALIEALTNTLTNILKKETLLPKLLRLQRLDVVDADGAVLIYRRLVDLCAGSEQEAQDLVDNIPWASMDTDDSDTHELLKASPLVPPLQLDSIIKYCEMVQSFAKLLQNHLPNEPPSTALNKAREEALDLIQLLNIEDCLYLVRNWLLSLAMCDVSFFVIVSPQPVAIGHDNHRERRDHPHACGGTGSIDIGSTCLYYCVRVVDCDMKMAHKLQSRQHSEHVLNHFFAGSE